MPEPLAEGRPFVASEVKPPDPPLLRIRLTLEPLVDEVRQYAEKFGAEFRPGERPWVVPCDLAIPCAIQNELEAKAASDN